MSGQTTLHPDCLTRSSCRDWAGWITAVFVSSDAERQALLYTDRYLYCHAVIFPYFAP